MSIRSSLRRHWYETIIIIIAVVTVLSSLVYRSPLGAKLLALERMVVEAILSSLGVRVFTLTYNSLLVVRGSNVLTLKIVPSCSSAYPILAFLLSAVILPRIRAHYRLQAVLLYVPLIFFLNVLRIVVTVVLGLYLGVEKVQVFHDYVGTLIGIVVFGGMWIYWLNTALTDVFRRHRPGETVTSLAAAAVALILVLLAAPLAGVAAAQEQPRVLVLVTDEPDTVFLQAWAAQSSYQLIPASLDNMTSLMATVDVVVLLDPNYGPGQVDQVRQAAEAALAGAEAGTPLVATLNGLSTLHLAGAFQDYRIQCNITWLPMPDEYKPDVYCLVDPPPYASLIEGPSWFLAVEDYGAGRVVIVPYNIVWAYLDSRDPVYVEIMEQAVAAALEEKGSTVTAAAVIAAVAAAVGAAGLANELRRMADVQASAGSGGSAGAVAPVFGFKRIDREGALDHPIRRSIVRLLEEEGSVTFNELWRKLGLSKATVSWHLSVLEREDIVGIIKYKKYKLVYLRGREDKIIDSLIRSRRGEVCVIARAVRQNNGVEWAARRLRSRPEAIVDVYRLVERRLDEVLQRCRGG